MQPLLQTNSKDDSIDFLTLNQESFDRLVTFIDFAEEKLTLGFVSVDFIEHREQIIAALQQQTKLQAIQFVDFNYDDPLLRFLGDRLEQDLKTIEKLPDRKLVVLLKGLEKSMGGLDAFPPLLQDLNYVRDSFVRRLPYPIIVFMPEYALKRLAEYAPDLWSWRLGVFRFETDLETLQQAIETEPYNEKILGSITVQEREERISFLWAMLDNLREQMVLSDREQIYADALRELGDLHYEKGDIEKATCLYKKSLDVCERIGNVQDKAVTLHQMAGIYTQQGQVNEAIALYQQSLELTEQIGNVQGKAATLHQMAIIYAQQGQVNEAIALYQQSLELEEQIGNVQGKAATLHQMAGIYTQQGQVNEAIALYQQSLELKEQIGNVQGKAATLHQMAIIYAQQGQVNEAIALYQQSLELHEQIGNVQGKAATLAMMGQLLADQRGDFDTAIAYLQESLAILQRIQSWEAQTVKEILSGVIWIKLMQSPQGEQIRQSLEAGDEAGAMELVRRVIQGE